MDDRHSHATPCYNIYTKSSAHQSHAIAATTRNFEIGCVLPLPSTAWLFFIVTDFMNFRLVFAHGSSVQDTLDVEAPVFFVRLFSSFVCPDEIQPAEVRAKGAHRPRQTPVRVRCICRFYRCLSLFIHGKPSKNSRLDGLWLPTCGSRCGWGSACILQGFQPGATHSEFEQFDLNFFHLFRLLSVPFHRTNSKRVKQGFKGRSGCRIFLQRKARKRYEKI